MENVISIRTLRMKDLPAKVGFQPSTIYGLIAEGKFPKPYKLTLVAAQQGGKRAQLMRGLKAWPLKMRT